MSVFVPLADTAPVLAILSRISMFGGVPVEKCSRIFEALESGFFKKGEFVFRKGEEPTHIYIVRSGCIDLRITDGDLLVEKKALRVGESFGEASLISMHRHTATAVAMEDSQIIVLSRHALIRLQQQDLGLFALLIMNIARELARRLQLTDDILLHYLHTREGGGMAPACDTVAPSRVTTS